MSLHLLRVISSINPESGGPIEGIKQITRHLQEKRAVETTVVSLDSPDNDYDICENVNSIALGPGIGRYKYSPGFKNKIRILAMKSDAVIIHGLWQYHSIGAWRALRGTNIPYFVYPHGMLDPWFKTKYPLRHEKKKAYWRYFENKVLRDASAVLFTTEQERILARQSFSLYNCKEIVVGYGTSAPPKETVRQRSAFLTAFPHLQDKRIILYLGRIHAKKGIDLLVEGFKSVAERDSSLHLVIAGPDRDGLNKELRKKSEKLSIDDRITWAGMLTGELKWGAYRSAELFCLPSHQENFGIAVAEAMACGLPVAISKPVNISNEVSKAKAGIIFEDTAKGTAEALNQWLDLELNECNAMGARGKLLFNRQYDFARVADKLLETLEIRTRHRQTT